jgi:Protein of unknown function (DUF2783)
MPLIRTLNLEDADAVYAAIAEAHRGLSAEASAALNARLVLLLANHVGDRSVIEEALAVARQDASPDATRNDGTTDH